MGNGRDGKREHAESFDKRRSPVLHANSGKDVWGLGAASVTRGGLYLLKDRKDSCGFGLDSNCLRSIGDSYNCCTAD